MIRIRFQRMGLKRQPTYRLVVTDSRKARNGAEIEVIGHHNPRTRPSTDIVKTDRALYWLSVGAQPSEAALSVLNRTGTMKLYERLRGGEALETLVAEAVAAQQAATPISPKTRFDAPVGKANSAAETAIAPPAGADVDDAGAVEDAE
jgi:small subunit ribosomal protein S16